MVANGPEIVPSVFKVNYEENQSCCLPLFSALKWKIVTNLVTWKVEISDRITTKML